MCIYLWRKYFLELDLQSTKNGSLETAVKKPGTMNVVDLSGEKKKKKFPSNFQTKGEEIVQNTPTIFGNNI